MEEDSIGSASGKQAMVKHENGAAKRRRLDSCLSSFMEISVDPGIKSLKHMDSKKFKSQIQRWAKAVVTYARQVSGRFGSSRRSPRGSNEKFGSSNRSRISGED